MTTAVWFDLDGTLLTLDRPYPQVLEETFEARLGRSSDALLDTFDEAFFAAFRDLEPDPYLTAMEAVREAADAPEGTAPRLVAELLEREVAATEPNAGVEDLLAALDGHPLGVLTNGLADWQRAKLEAHGLADRFDAVVVSYDVGAHKPDEAIFAAARDRVDADGHVLVGDDGEADVGGAQAAGFRAVHVDPDADAETVRSPGALADLVRLGEGAD